LERRRHLAELDRRNWHLWVLSLGISLALALGILAFFFPVIQWGVVRIDFARLHNLPQLVVGQFVLVILAAAYILVKQRELNELRSFLISTYAQVPPDRDAYALDPLTGTLDRRALSDILQLESARANRYRTSFCLVLCDVREFSKVNAREGHLAADLVLKELAELLRATVRRTDLVMRYGPDEFLCLLPATDQEGGRLFSARVVKALARSRRLAKYTLDFGSAAYFPKATLDGVVAEAEQDLDRKRAKPSLAVAASGHS
jgi:diguanylate cyclase (GGDEF)-like protein